MKENNTLQFVGGIIATVITLTAFAFTTFQMKEDAEINKIGIEKRLDKIEDKIDLLIIRISK